MDLVNIIEAYINTNNNIDNVQLYVIELIEQLEFLYDICYCDDDSDYSEVFTEDESDEEPFTPEELQELNNITVGRNGEFYFIN